MRHSDQTEGTKLKHENLRIILSNVGFCPENSMKQIIYFRPNEPSLIFCIFTQIIRKVNLFWPFVSIYLKSKVTRRFPFLQNKTELFPQEGKSLHVYRITAKNLASTGFPSVAWENIFTGLLKGKVKLLCLLKGQNLQQSS